MSEHCEQESVLMHVMDAVTRDFLDMAKESGGKLYVQAAAAASIMAFMEAAYEFPEWHRGLVEQFRAETPELDGPRAADLAGLRGLTEEVPVEVRDA